jgi:hypothetical protein
MKNHLRQNSPFTESGLTMRAPDPRQRASGPWWWESGRFQALYVAWGWFRQSGVVSSRLVVDWRSRVETHQRVPRREHAGLTRAVRQSQPFLELK